MLRSTRPMPMCSLTKKISTMIQGVAGCPVRIVYLLRVKARHLYPLMEPTINVRGTILQDQDGHRKRCPRLVGREFLHNNLLPTITYKSTRYTKSPPSVQSIKRPHYVPH